MEVESNRARKSESDSFRKNGGGAGGEKEERGGDKGMARKFLKGAREEKNMKAGEGVNERKSSRMSCTPGRC